MIRGLTLWQPWAWAICYAGKRIENRTWAPPAQLTHVAIHAGMKYDTRSAEAIRALGHEVPGRGDIASRAIVAVARVVATTDASDDPWFAGPLGWVLEDVRVLDAPVERAGALGCWRLTARELRSVRRQTGLSLAS